jgi:hypothetical protein
MGDYCCGPHGVNECDQGCVNFCASETDPTVCQCGHKNIRHRPAGESMYALILNKPTCFVSPIVLVLILCLAISYRATMLPTPHYSLIFRLLLVTVFLIRFTFF